VGTSDRLLLSLGFICAACGMQGFAGPSPYPDVT
jgi:hypothetical protein